VSFWKTQWQSDPRGLWPLRHLIRVMRGHDLTNKKTITKTKTKTKTNTFRKHLQRATLETCDLWDIWSEWWRDMTWPKKKTMTKTNTMTKTMTKTNTFRKHLQRATLETCDLWAIWSEWWGDLTWSTKRQWKRQVRRQRQLQRQIHLENTFKERPQSLVTFETFDQSDEGTRPYQKNTMAKTNTKTNAITKTMT